MASAKDFIRRPLFPRYRSIPFGGTLLKPFPTDAIETILAHELERNVNCDIPLSMVFETRSTMVGCWAVWFRWGRSHFLQ